MKVLKKVLPSVLAAVVLLAIGRFCPAQQETPTGPKPLVTVAFSGYDELRKDIESLVESPELIKKINDAFRQGPGQELDPARPWGFVVQTDSGQFPMFAFLPVTDFGKFVTSLKPFGARDIGDGLFEIPARDQILYLKEGDGNWAFLGRTPDELGKVPADPTEALDDLHNLYDVAIRISVANIPPSLRQMAIGMLQMGAQRGMQRLPDETDEQYALRSQMTQRGMEQFSQMINELDMFQIGLNIDSTTEAAYLDFTATALEGTETAKKMASGVEIPSDFAGFVLPGAAVTLNAISIIKPEDIEQAKSAFPQLRDKAQAELLKQRLPKAELEQAEKLLDGVLEVLESTIEGGRMDIGMSLMLDPDATTFVGGASVGDSAKLEALIKDYVNQMIQQEPEVAQAVTFDAEEHAGVRFHVLSLPTAGLADEAPYLPGMVGDTLDIVVGIGSKSAYLAAGRDAAKTLKQAIDGSKTMAEHPVLPLKIVISATPIAEFVAATAQNDQAKTIASMVVTSLKQDGQQDHLAISNTSIPNGMEFRIELEKGVLRLIGLMSTTDSLNK